MESTVASVATADAQLTRIHDVELYVHEPEGEGPPLVLIHGGWTDHTTWSRLVPSLSSSLRVVRRSRLPGEGVARTMARTEVRAYVQFCPN